MTFRRARAVMAQRMGRQAEARNLLITALAKNGVKQIELYLKEAAR